jgi:hypothetical protein
MSPNLWYFIQGSKVMVISNDNTIKESRYVDYPRFLQSIGDISTGLRPAVEKFEFESVVDFINFRILLT